MYSRKVKGLFPDTGKWINTSKTVAIRIKTLKVS